MHKNVSDKKPGILLLTPLLGIGIFILLYIWAACLYPGGSKANPQATHFSILHNYWCDLFDIVTMNGSSNPARPVAMFAMVVLTGSFAVLWYLLPQLFAVKNRRQKIIQYAGISSMIIAAFLFTPYHEAVIDLAGLLGGLALAITFIELYKADKKKLFYIGMTCFALSGLNYFIYETGILLPVLASTQKITFLVFFIWAGLINMEIYGLKSADLNGFTLK